MDPDSLTALKTSTLFSGKEAEALGDTLAEPSPLDRPVEKIGNYQRNGKKEKYVI